MSAPTPTDYLVVGRIRRAHGIRGELVVETITDAPDAIFASGHRVFAGSPDGTLSPGRPELVVERASPFKGGMIVKFRGLETRNDAEPWRERTLLVPEEEVEPPREDELFVHDLVGMRVELVSGEPVGEVREVFELPQGFVLDVARPGKGSVMVQLHESAVVEVDPESRVVKLDPPAGLLD